MAGCIDRGLDAVKPEQEVLRKQVEEIQEIAGTLDPKEGNSAQRQAQFQELIEHFVAQGDSFHEHLAKVIRSFQPGLFAGRSSGSDPRQSRFGGAGFAYSRGMSVGSTVTNMPVFGSSRKMSHEALALDAHQGPPTITVDDLLPYRSARMPECQRQAMNQHRVSEKGPIQNQTTQIAGRVGTPISDLSSHV